MKFNEKENIKNKNGFLVACVCSILLLLTLCYFGINSDFKGTSAVVTDTVHCLNGRDEVTYNSQTVCCPTGYEEIKNINGELYCVDTSKEAKVTYTGTASDEDNETPDDETVCGQIYGSNWYVYVADDWNPYANTALDSKEGSCGYHCGAWTGGTADCYKVCKFCYSTEHTVEYPIDTEKGDYCFRENSTDVYYYGTFGDYDYDAGWDNFDKYTHIEEYDGDEEACLSNNTYEVKFNYNYADNHTTEPVTATYKFASPHGFYSDLTKTVVIKEYEISGVTIEKSINNKNYLLELAGWQFEYTDSDINEYAQYSLDDKKTWEKITFSTGPVKATNVENYTWFKMLRKRYADEYAIINAIWKDYTITLPVAKSGVKECFWKIDDGSNDIKYVSSGGKYVIPNNSTNTISITPDCSTTGRFTASFYEDGELTSSKMCIKKWKEEACPSNEICETTLQGGYYSCDAGAITSPDSSKKWYTSETCSGTAVTFSTYSLTGDRSFYSCSSGGQTTNNYTITFDANGGSVSLTTKTVTAGSTYGELPTPSYDNHTFNGWYTKESGGDKITADSIVPTYNHTLFAQWLDNTTSDEETPNTCSESVSNDNKTVWTKSSCNGTYINGKLYVWSDTQSCCLIRNVYYIDYSYNGGSAGENAPKSGVVGYGSLPSAIIGSEKYDYVLISKPSKKVTITGNQNNTNATVGSATSKSQTFAGWTLSGGNTDTAKYGTSSSSITTDWSSSSTKVNAQYFKDLSSTSGATVRMTANWTASSMTVPTLTSPTGYTCTWNKNADGSGISYTSGQSYTPSNTSESAITLYAQCKANTYTVEYKGNGSTSGSMSNSSHTYGSSETLTKNAFVRTNYTFIGWNTKADGSGSSYADGAAVTNLTETNNGTVTLYAQWSSSATDKKTATLTIEEETISLEVGADATFEYTYTGDTANNEIACTSSNTSVAVCELVNGKLKVIAKSKGSSRVTLNASATSTYKAASDSLTVTVVSSGSDEEDTDTTTEQTFTATFIENGGTINESDSRSCTTTGDSCDITDLPTATRDDYIFKGWSTESTCTDVETSKITLKSDSTYYACWLEDEKDDGSTDKPIEDEDGNLSDGENPGTGDIAIAFVIFIGLFAIGYAFNYFKSLKEN